MIKFLLRTISFFVCIFIIDFFAGKCLSIMVKHAKGGDNGRNNYICDVVESDVLIFGSSRAIHHYNPNIISDSLGLSCYNCGQDGNGSILNYGRYQLICQRYHPKLLIYDIMPRYDLLEGEDNQKYLGWLKAYYDRPGIAELFEAVDFTEKYKMCSNMYRYNTKFIQIISDFLSPRQSKGINGFRPINKEMDLMKVPKNNTKGIYNEDSLKLYFLNKMIDTSSDTKVVFIVSPSWNGMDTASIEPIRKICLQKKIPFYDFSNAPKYLHKNIFFRDGNHLNAKGADEFTKDLIKYLRIL